MTAVKQIPETLIYEMDNGQPIYYSGYKNILNGQALPTAIMGSSILQSLIISYLSHHLINILPKNYFVLNNEVGILFSKGSWRLADIAIIEKARIKTINDKYISVPPNVVIEIDTKAALEDYANPQEYYKLKTQQYLDFGIDKVIWIFTKNRTIEVTTKSSKTKHVWDEAIQILEDVKFNLEDLMKDQLA